MVTSFLEEDLLLLPFGINRPIPKSVPQAIARDFKEACGTLCISKRASATLSRRCLQHLLRKEEKAHESNLKQEIEKVMDSSALPPLLQKSLHLIRNLGIIAAHPLEDSETDEIIEIEEGEVELVIDILGQLIDYYYETIPQLEETAKKAEARVGGQKRPPKK